MIMGIAGVGLTEPGSSPVSERALFGVGPLVRVFSQKVFITDLT